MKTNHENFPMSLQGALWDMINFPAVLEIYFVICKRWLTAFAFV